MAPKPVMFIRVHRALLSRVELAALTRRAFDLGGKSGNRIFDGATGCCPHNVIPLTSSDAWRGGAADWC
jgi:hypothetical protein